MDGWQQYICYYLIIVLYFSACYYPLLQVYTKWIHDTSFNLMITLSFVQSFLCCHLLAGRGGTVQHAPGDCAVCYVARCRRFR